MPSDGEERERERGKESYNSRRRNKELGKYPRQTEEEEEGKNGGLEERTNYHTIHVYKYFLKYRAILW